MRKSIFLVLAFFMFISQAFAGETNLFNPYIHATLPTGKSGRLQGENAKMAQSLGAHAASLQSEVHYRQFWRQEVYPIVFGNAKAPHEVLVFLDYALPQSQNLWEQVLMASRSMNAQQLKIVVFAKSTEPYGTELMGGGIWVAYSHPALALDYYTYTLQRWNAVKQAQRGQGAERPFVSEYDATLGTELPILYSYLERVKHFVPAQQHFPIAQYAFDAGNINMYQASLAAQAYDVHHFPAVVVNGKALTNVTAQKILDALR